MTNEERIAELENALLNLKEPIAEMPENLDFGNRQSVTNGCLKLIATVLSNAEQGEEKYSRFVHLEQQRDHLQARNTELVEKNRLQQTTIEAHERCEESLRAALQSSRIALRKSATRTYDSTTKLFEPNAAAQWLDDHPDPS